MNEPYVKIMTAAELSEWTKADEILDNQQRRQQIKYEAFKNFFDMLNENCVVGDYLEFGCHRVRTFRMALTEAYKHSLDMRFYAFDSFRGLPDHTIKSEHPGWTQGALSTPVDEFWRIVKAHGLYIDKIFPIEGYYSESLSEELLYRQIEVEKVKAALITVDCDLYESARDVFNYVIPLIQAGSIVYLDDYWAGHKSSPVRGVAAAFAEFIPKLERSGYKMAEHLTIGWWGKSFIAYPL